MEESGRKLLTLGGEKKAKTFGTVKVTDDHLRTSALPSDKKTQKEVFAK